MIDGRVIVNGCVALLATGGSTNHTMHLVAIGQRAGITLTWNDISELSPVIPLLARIYPNGSADVNHFHAAGGLGFTIATLLDAGLLHEDVQTVVGPGLRRYTQEPTLDGDAVMWLDGTTMSHDTSVLRGVEEPFDTDGGLKTLAGNLGSCVIKTSAVKAEHRAITAPAVVFDDQADFLAAFDAGELDGDLIAVLRYQGPRDRHARTAQTHTSTRGAAGPRPPGRPGDRRQNVRSLRKGPGRNPSHPGSRHGRSAGAGAQR